MAENTASMAQADLRRVASAARKLENVKGELRVAILRARESGETYVTSAKLPASRPRIIQIVREGTQLKLPLPPE